MAPLTFFSLLVTRLTWPILGCLCNSLLTLVHIFMCPQGTYCCNICLCFCWDYFFVHNITGLGQITKELKAIIRKSFVFFLFHHKNWKLILNNDRAYWSHKIIFVENANVGNALRSAHPVAVEEWLAHRTQLAHPWRHVYDLLLINYAFSRHLCALITPCSHFAATQLLSSVNIPRFILFQSLWLRFRFGFGFKVFFFYFTAFSPLYT